MHPSLKLNIQPSIIFSCDGLSVDLGKLIRIRNKFARPGGPQGRKASSTRNLKPQTSNLKIPNSPKSWTKYRVCSKHSLYESPTIIQSPM